MGKTPRALALLLFFGPMTTGLEAEGQGGFGNFQYGGCASQDYNVRALSAAAAIRVKTPVGFTAELDGSTVGGRVRSTRTGVSPDMSGLDVQTGAGMARIGWQWRYGGAELGAGLASTAPDSYSQSHIPAATPMRIFPSASGWVGIPDYAYLWGSFAAEPFVFPDNARPPFFVGIGHTSEWIDIRAGYLLGALFRATLKVDPLFQPGIDVRYLDARNWQAALTLRFTVALFDAP